MRVPARRSSIVTLVGVLGLLAAACQTETLTSLAGDDGAAVAPTPFPMSSDAVNMVKTASHRLVKPFMQLALLGKPQSGIGSSSPITDSPWDLTYVGGPLVTHATSYDVYVNCATTAVDCWGSQGLSPASFLRDLNRSVILHVADQYLGVRAPGQFSVAELSTTADFTGTLADSSIRNVATFDDVAGIIISAFIATRASGYTSIYHVFLPKGTDMCIDPNTCYSPDNPDSFVFCAFHGSFDVQNRAGQIFHLLFSVQPYQNVDGCAIPGQTPHGTIDATATALSHEFFETITDPDLDSWFNLLTGNEVADLCFGFRNNEHVGTHAYVIQSEYSNAAQLCTDQS
ncbi:MAG TPA: hypothetical protein VLV45_10110 [Gemmatimonadales bacterium]|nr:hypothetical protein [Gemmatimonadales bacterium]